MGWRRSLSNPARERHFSRQGGCRMNRAEWWAQQGKRESSRAQIHQSGCPPSEPLSSLSALAMSRHPSGMIQLRDELWRPSVAAVRPPLPSSKQVKIWNVLVVLVKYTTIRYFINTIGEQNAATTHFVKTEGVKLSLCDLSCAGSESICTDSEKKEWKFHIKLF